MPRPHRAPGRLRLSIAVGGVAAVLVIATAAPAADDELFEARIRPLLAARCQGCHSAAAGGRREGALALDSRQGWQAGGESGPAIVPGEPAASRLIRAVKRAEGVSAMPPPDAGPPLSPAEVESLETWIRSGAVDPRDGAARLGGMDREAAGTWWSFSGPRAVSPPSVQ
ncbi:MAG: c-type cytochrome domain-containing protein, partial [Planctomycetia bacterium]